MASLFKKGVACYDDHSDSLRSLSNHSCGGCPYHPLSGAGKSHQEKEVTAWRHPSGYSFFVIIFEANYIADPLYL